METTRIFRARLGWQFLRLRWVMGGAIVMSLSLLTEQRPAHAQPQAAAAALPTTQLWSISPLGGKQGTTVELKITTGADLDGVDRLLFSNPKIVAKPKTEMPVYGGTAQPVAGVFLVTIPSDVPPGNYDVRAIGDYGISNPRAFVVGQLEEVLEPADNNAFNKAAAITLESVVNGTANAANPDFYKFAAKKGQRVILDVWAQRIDSRMDASLIVFNAQGAEVARNRNMNRRDPLVDLAVPADGEYVVAVYDFLYEGGNEHFYRLQAHTGPYIDFVYPPVGQPGSKSQYTIYGRNLPGGVPAKGVEVAGRPLDKLTTTIELPADPGALASSSLVASSESMLDGFEFRLKGSQIMSNPFLIGFSLAPVVMEVEPNNEPAKAQKVTTPCEFVGQFGNRADEDWLQFDAKKGAVFTVEIVSQRLGLPTDPSVLIQRVTKDEKGVEKTNDVTELDDEAKDLGGPPFTTATGDSSYRLQINDDGVYRILVRDLHGAVGDPRRMYRLSIRELKPDFRLAAVTSYPTMGRDARPWTPCARRGGSETIDVLAFRRDGFNEPIEVSVEGLPSGVVCQSTLIGPDQDSVPLVFVAAENAAQWAGVIKIVGKSKVGDQSLTRVARGGAATWPAVGQGNQPPNKPADARITREIAFAVQGGETVPVTVVLGEGKAWDMSRAGKVEIPVKVTRRDGFKEALTLTALGLPAAFKPQPLAIAADKSEGKLAIDIPGNAPLGTFSFYLRSPAKVSYKRDPSAVGKAVSVKKDMEKLSTDLAATVKAAEKAVQDADKVAKDAAAALQKATDANRADLTAKAKAATDAKAKADQSLKDAQAKAKAATDAKTVADKKATDMENAAKPKDLNIVVPSNVVRLTITPAPIKLDVKSPQANVKKGDKLELAVAAQRLYGFADQIDLEVALPPELKNVKATPSPIAKGKDDAKIMFEAAKDASAGTFTITLRGKPKFNNQNLQVEQTFTLKVE